MCSGYIIVHYPLLPTPNSTAHIRVRLKVTVKARVKVSETVRVKVKIRVNVKFKIRVKVKIIYEFYLVCLTVTLSSNFIQRNGN